MARIVEIAGKDRLEAVAVAGDLKDVRNPWDARVIHLWRGFIARLREVDCALLAVLGNHDLTSLTHTDSTWMPLLEDAGAVVFERPGAWESKDGSRIHALPFSPDTGTFAEYMKTLAAANPDPEADVLVFHETLIGASWNRQTDVGEGEASVSLASMKPERYRYVLGGDIHMHQQLGPNAWYVGGPFPHTWGECNQRKVFALIRDNDPIRFASTGAAGWYDPAVPSFQAPKSWNGAKVRIRVQTAAGRDYAKAALEAKADAIAKYPGADIVVKPAPAEGETVEVDSAAGKTEDDRIRRYVEKAVREEDVEAAMAYIAHAAGSGRERSGGVKFRKVEGRDFLCFKELEMRLDTPGITVVTGINHDRPGKSNGSGKTSLLSALPVALFGQTFKKQKADAWARRGTKSASVAVEFETPDGQIMRAERTRGPAAVRLYSGGAEISAGGRQDNVGADIASFCGFTWDMFTSAVFLSQEDIGAFLWGTPKDRYEAIARMQGLERFDAAWENAGKQVRREERKLKAMQDDVRSVREKLAAIKEISNVNQELHSARQAQFAAETARNDAAAAVPDTPSGEPKRHAREKWRKRTAKREKASAAASRIRAKIREIETAPEVCPTCGKRFDRDKSKLEATLKDLQADLLKAQAKAAAAEQSEQKAEKAYDKADKAHSSAWAAHQAAEAVLEEVSGKLEAARGEVRKWERRRNDERDVVSELKESLKIREAAEAEINASLEFALQMQRLLARDGLPAYLCQTLCPRLNEAADHFSDLFTDGEIRVRFAVEGGKAMVDVINPNGGETVRDQSTGEGRVAALIACFALRETADLANVLILDEPGQGLDAESYRTFAAGLKSMADSGSIFVVTHDAGLASELSGARHISIEKRDGVSRLLPESSVQ